MTAFSLVVIPEGLLCDCSRVGDTAPFQNPAAVDQVLDARDVLRFVGIASAVHPNVVVDVLHDFVVRQCHKETSQELESC